MAVRGFVIHLARATQRRAQVDALLAGAPCPTEVFAAVDGQAMPEAEVAAVYPEQPLLRPPYPFRIGRGELACFLSHRAIWQRMVDEGIDQALILEDDVALGPGFAAAYGLACRFAGTDGFVQFQTRAIGDAVEVIATEGAVQIVRPRVVPRRTSAQLVGRRAAERLLQACAQIDRPVDGFLQLVWETKQPIHCVLPSGATDLTAAVGGTTIQKRPKARALEQLRRSVLRFWYRRAIRNLSRGSENEKT